MDNLQRFRDLWIGAAASFSRAGAKCVCGFGHTNGCGVFWNRLNKESLVDGQLVAVGSVDAIRRRHCGRAGLRRRTISAQPRELITVQDCWKGMPTILCIASFFKGNEFIRECRRQGGHVVLLTREKLLNEEWARDAIDDLIAIPGRSSVASYLMAA